MVQPQRDLSPSQPGRSTLLAALLGGFMFLCLLGFFYLVSPGAFIITVGVIGGMCLFAGLHYVLWGKAFMKETAAERERLLAADAGEKAPTLPYDRRY